MALFDIGSPRGILSAVAAVFAIIAAGASMKYVAETFFKKSKPKLYRVVGKVGELWIYPIKSMKGIRLQEANVGRCGLEWGGLGDRHWVVTDANGLFMTQRRYPTMALIQPVLCGLELELQAPGMEPIRFPVNPTLNSSNLSKATLFGDTIPSLDIGDEVGDWLSRFLDKEGVRLRFSESSLEKRDSSRQKQAWGNPAIEGDLVAFPDWSSYMILAQESVDYLNTKLETPLPATQYRANILVHDCEAFAEDSWCSVRINDSQLRAIGCCPRCVLPNVNQETGVKDDNAEPLTTLKTFRKKAPYGETPVFGVNLAHDKSGIIRVGDAIYGLEGSML